MKWVAGPLERCMNYIYDADRLLHLSINGIIGLSKMEPVAEALAAYQRHRNPDRDVKAQEKHLDETRQRVALAKTEVESGFPLLHAHTIVAIWGALEVFTRDLLTEWLLHDANAMSNKAISGIKVPLAVFEKLDRRDRMCLLVTELERSVRPEFKPGVARFEALLDAIGLSGPVDASPRRTLYEMSQVRNLIVHCASIVDQKFLEACPWLTVNIGDTLALDHDKYRIYFMATERYLVCLVNRINAHFGLAQIETEKACENCLNTNNGCNAE